MRKTLARKLRFLLVYPLLAWLLLLAHTTERQLHLGIGLAALGLLLRVWANGYVGHVKVNWTQRGRRHPQIGQLVTAGPYAYIRHPLYLGTFLIGGGFCLIAGHLWVSLAALGFFLIVYRRKMVQEEILLRDEVGTPYIVYQAAVPRWLPTWQRYPNRQGQWSWAGIAASKEWKTLIWVVVVIIALYLREEIVQEHEFFPPGEWLKHTLLLITGLMLMLTDGTIELLTRRKRTLVGVLVAVGLFSGPDPSWAAPTTYVLDQEHSHVRFTGSAMGHRFHGRAQALQGRLDFDPAHDQLLRPAEILISVGALTTDNTRRDQDMWEMFEVASYPVIRCVLTRLVPLSHDPPDASGARRYHLEGRLQIRAIEQPVAFEVVATVTPELIEASGELLLTTSAFALSPPALMLGLVRVRKQVHVEFASRWMRQP